jgi:hypothetical protein
MTECLQEGVALACRRPVELSSISRRTENFYINVCSLLRGCLEDPWSMLRAAREHTYKHSAQTQHPFAKVVHGMIRKRINTG